MSLLYWWPFTKDGSNQGLRSTAPLTSAIVTGGKIGNFSSLDENINLGITSASPDIDIYSQIDNELSYAFWLKIESNYLNTFIEDATFTDSKKNINNCIIGFNGSTSSIGLCLFSKLENLTNDSTFSSIPLTMGMRHTGGSASISLGQLSLDQWHHIAITYSGTTFKGYIDGQYIAQKSLSRAALGSTKALILNSSSFFSGTYANYFNIPLREYFNDVRIYDHCLSPKEVEEIAKGLVLHYKLNKSFNLINSNVYQWTNFTLGQWYSQIASIPMSDLVNLGLKTGDKITYSVDVKAASGQKVLCLRIQQYNSSSDRPNTYSINTIQPSEEGRLQVTAILDTSYDSVQLLIGNSSSSTVTSNTTEQWKCIKLEIGDIATPWEFSGGNNVITDCSGYNNNGVINGTLNAAAGDSPRYDCSTTNLSTGYITCPIMPSEVKTLSFWLKSSKESGCFIIEPNSGLGFGFASSGGRIILSTWSQQYINSSLFIENEWNHIVVTKESDSLAKCYINGQEAVGVGSTTSWNHDNSNMWLFWRDRNSSFHGVGQLSDVRVYTTVLNETAIKELYDTSGSIDSKGNIYARDFISQNNTSFQLSKTGIITSPYFLESNNNQASISNNETGDNQKEIISYQFYEY